MPAWNNATWKTPGGGSSPPKHISDDTSIEMVSPPLSPVLMIRTRTSPRASANIGSPVNCIAFSSDDELRIFPGTAWTFFSATSESTTKYIIYGLVIALSAFGTLILFADYFFLLDASFWKGGYSKTLSNPRHCEPVNRDHFMFQPLNALTTICYVFVGAVVSTFGYLDGVSDGSCPPNVISLCPLISLSVGLSCSFVGYTSFLYHASYSARAAELDVASMYILLAILDGIVFLRFCLCARGKNIHILRFQANLCCLISVAIGVYLFAARASSSIELVMEVDQVFLIVVMMVGFALGLATWPRVAKSWAYGFLAILLMGSAAGCWALDKAGECEPLYSIGHPAWHMLNSGALLSAYLFLRSEHMPMGA